MMFVRRALTHDIQKGCSLPLARITCSAAHSCKRFFLAKRLDFDVSGICRTTEDFHTIWISYPQAGDLSSYSSNHWNVFGAHRSHEKAEVGTPAPPGLRDFMTDPASIAFLVVWPGSLWRWARTTPGHLIRDKKRQEPLEPLQTEHL